MGDFSQLSVNSLLYSSIALAVAPLLLGGGTCYVKVSLVISALRNAFGSQQIPGNILVSTFSICISFMIMEPVLNETMLAWEHSGHIASSMNTKTAKAAPQDELKLIESLSLPWRRFMLNHAGDDEVRFMCELGSMQMEKSEKKPDTDQCNQSSDGASDEVVLAVPFQRTMAAFLLSEVKSGFSMAFLLLVPFLIIDMAVAIILTGLNMQMVSPLIISFPLKLLLFVVSDAWQLLFEALVLSYQ
jgi:type III secretory pathway component EscR